MKDNKLSIIIKQPAKLIFDFTLNPNNTPKWIDGIKSEETNEWPPKIGTTYLNVSVDNIPRQYIVTELVDEKMFTLVSHHDGNFSVRYTFTKIDDHATEFAYHEWVDNGYLADPFTYSALEKLKMILET